MFSESQASSIRFPSTANLQIFSRDRNVSNFSSCDFTINKQENILSGYFTRFGVCEMVLFWNIPNINALYNNSAISVTYNGVTQNFTFQDGFYTVEALMDGLVPALNNAFGAGIFVISGSSGHHSLLSTALPFTINGSNLARNMSFTIGQQLQTNNFFYPKLYPNEFTYIDFTCSNLTYQQGLKDGSTAPNVRDVLYRWYLAWDTPPAVDGLGYPILQGYQPFNQRRYLNFPKQIKWDTQQPIGGLSFQVYDALGDTLRYIGDDALPNPATGGIEWSMNLLVSEQ